MKETNKLSFIDQELDRRREQCLLRTTVSLTPANGAKTVYGQREMDNFCSNDYLALSQHPLLKQRSREYIDHFGTGSTASRLVCGTSPVCLALEEKLARLKGTEAALIFSTGYQANVTLLPILADRSSIILSDRLNHNSLIIGTRLARCRVELFHHNDLTHLRSLLEKHRSKGYSRMVITTESVFSMDGVRSDVASLVAMANEFNALLMVDEAHATGVLGSMGMGLTVGHGVDLTVGTFGKALGSFGAYAACSAKMRDYLVNCCPGLIYTTALPPAVLGAIDAALDLIPTMDKERTKLHDMAKDVRRQIRSMGYDTGLSSTQIIPVIVGHETEALELSTHLHEQGILAMAIRPPTVSPGLSRIRLTLSAAHSDDQIQHLLDALS